MSELIGDASNRGEIVGKISAKNSVSGGLNFANGKDGISATHEWNGTVLTMTSASGTSSADLKGDIGNPGVYIGSGDMPEGYNVQIDPNGEPMDVVAEVLAALPTWEGGSY